MSFLEMAKQAESRLKQKAERTLAAEEVGGQTPSTLQDPLGDGLALEIKVPWLKETLWYVPSDSAGEDLTQEGVSRGRIWTPREFDTVFATQDLSQEQLQSLARAKFRLGGTVVAVRSSQRPTNQGKLLNPSQDACALPLATGEGSDNLPDPKESGMSEGPGTGGQDSDKPSSAPTPSDSSRVNA